MISVLLFSVLAWLTVTSWLVGLFFNFIDRVLAHLHKFVVNDIPCG